MTQTSPDTIPVLSIITVVYNGAALLPGTMESVRQQSLQAFEYWIVDGGSSDGTVDLIRAYAAQMPNLHWVSERDKGLYDAMNKALHLVRGEFIWFLNAGDHLHAANTVEKMLACREPNTDVFYGDTMLVDDTRKPVGLMSELGTRSLPANLHWRHYLGGMRVVHQSFVPRRSLAPDYLYGNLCADYDWCIRILKKSRRNTFVGQTLSDYLMGGISKKRHRQSLRDRFAVMREHFGLIPTLLAHGWIILRAIGHWIRRWGKPSY